METEETQIQAEEKAASEEGGRIDRIADQTRGLIDDIKDWIDLKVQLVQLDLEERFESMANQILATIIVIVLAFITILFALIAGSLALGNWLGDPLWGFLIVTGLLALITLIVHIRQPRIVKAPWKKKAKALPEATEKQVAAQLPRIAETTQDETKNG